MQLNCDIRMEVSEHDVKHVLDIIERALVGLKEYVPSGANADIGFIETIKTVKDSWSFNTNKGRLVVGR